MWSEGGGAGATPYRYGAADEHLTHIRDESDEPRDHDARARRRVGNPPDAARIRSSRAARPGDIDLGRTDWAPDDIDDRTDEQGRGALRAVRARACRDLCTRRGTEDGRCSQQRRQPATA